MVGYMATCMSDTEGALEPCVKQTQSLLTVSRDLLVDCRRVEKGYRAYIHG